jgi:hypothetical protein
MISKLSGLGKVNMADRAVTEKVTDEDIRDAVKALRVGETRLEQVREAFYEGRGSWDEVKSQEAVIEYATADLERLQRARSRYEADVRSKELDALRAEIESFAAQDAPVAVDLLKAVEPTVVAYAKHFADRNAQIAGFHARMLALNVEPTSTAHLVPQRKHGRLATRGADVQAGDLILSAVDGGRFLQSLIAGLAASHEIDRKHLVADVTSGSPADAIYAQLGAVDNFRQTISREGHFYRGPGGGLFHVAEPFPAEQVKRNGLTEVTPEQAFDEDED